jgi:hypothetical protein
MARFLPAGSVLIGCLSLLIGSPPAQTRSAVELRVALKGLPEETSGGVLLLCIVQLENGKVTEIRREDPASEISVDAPAGPLALEATYVSSSADVVLEGSAVTSEDKSVEITMESASSAASPGRSSLPTYPPAEGMAVGYNPADFTATGPGAEPGMGPAFARVVITELSQAPCAAGDSPPYQVVESANPRGMALIEAELELQADPSFDPAERITPHIIEATHLVKGTFSVGEDSIIAELRVEDLEGEVIAQATASGPIESPFEAIEDAARSLADQLCKK